MDDRQRARLDSRLEAEGAEFLVLGLLLAEGIQATKAYTRYPGYDVLAINPEQEKVCRIQVKSRWATDYDRSFPIKNFDCDFIVHVALNRGYRGYRRQPTAEQSGREPPAFYVFPVDVVRKAQDTKSSWHKVKLRDIDECERYRDDWGQIARFLNLERPS